MLHRCWNLGTWAPFPSVNSKQPLHPNRWTTQIVHEFTLSWRHVWASSIYQFAVPDRHREVHGKSRVAGFCYATKVKIPITIYNPFHTNIKSLNGCRSEGRSYSDYWQADFRLDYPHESTSYYQKVRHATAQANIVVIRALLYRGWCWRKWNLRCANCRSKR